MQRESTSPDVIPLFVQRLTLCEQLMRLKILPTEQGSYPHRQQDLSADIVRSDFSAEREALLGHVPAHFDLATDKCDAAQEVEGNSDAQFVCQVVKLLQA